MTTEGDEDRTLQIHESLNRPVPDPEPDQEAPAIDVKSMVGKQFIRKVPGIYIGAKYRVLDLLGTEKFLVERNDPAHGVTQFHLSCKEFISIMMEPEPPKPAPKSVEVPKKPSSPWKEDRKK